MGIIITVIYIISFIAWIGAVFWLPRTKEKENGLIWLILCLVLYECWAAFITGLMSLSHIPVTVISVAIANFISAAIIFILYKRLDCFAGARNDSDTVIARGSAEQTARSISDEAGDEAIQKTNNSKSVLASRQRFSFSVVDIAFAVCLAVFCIYVWHIRFGQEAAIIYATIDPADRFSRAVGILTERTVIGPYPNMYFGHITNALFMGAAEPFFQGAYMVRAFIIKDVINIWLAGMLFYSALRQLSDKPFAKAIFFILGFAYTLGFPWNNQLWGFGYIGMAVTMIILVQMGARFLKDEKQAPAIGFIIIAAGCFCVGISYTMFAPPVFITAFIFILMWSLSSSRALTKRSIAKIALTEIKVFAVPVILVVVFTVLIGRGEAGTDLGEQFMIEGAIYRNLLGDFLIWLPLALFAVVFFLRKLKWHFSWVFGIVFVIYQAYFLYRMISGSVSTYYYYKLNFVTWFVVLFLAGAAIVFLTQGGGKRVMTAIGCWIFVFFIAAVFTVRGYDFSLKERNELMNPIPAASGLFGIYANNNAYFNYPENNIVYFGWDFIALCEAARAERIAQPGAAEPGDFFENRVEIITNSFHAVYWADALTGEHIKQKRALGIDEMPDSDAKIWIVIKGSDMYKENADQIDKYQKVFENDLGFVVIRS